MKKSLASLVFLAALSSLAHAEGAVEQAPGHLLAMADMNDRALAATVQAPSTPLVMAPAEAELEEVATELNKKLEARLEARMTRDLRLAMQ